MNDKRQHFKGILKKSEYIIPSSSSGKPVVNRNSRNSNLEFLPQVEVRKKYEYWSRYFYNENNEGEGKGISKCWFDCHVKYCSKAWPGQGTKFRTAFKLIKSRPGNELSTHIQPTNLKNMFFSIVIWQGKQR